MSKDGQLFLGLMQLQGSSDMVTKTELRKGVEGRGESISERTLTTFITRGLVPKSARVGTTAGVFPAIVVDLVYFILKARKAKVALDSIKELLPVWHFLKLSVLHPPFELDLMELERIVRREVQSREAVCAVPWLVSAVVAREFEGDTTLDLTVRYKTRTEDLNDSGPHVISFAVLDHDGQASGQAYIDGQIDVVLPRAPATSLGRDTVFIGAPLGVAVVDRDFASEREAEVA